MPIGTIKKLVHLSAQASRLQNAALVPTRNTIGYGIIEAGDGERLYFDAEAAQVVFEDLRIGQTVEYQRDQQYAIATAVQPTNHAPALAPKDEARPASPETRSPASRSPVPSEGPKPKKGEEAPTLVLSSTRQCLVVARYEKVAPGQWRRVGKLPEIETYTADVADPYREPVVTELSPTRAVIRVYDERAVNLQRTTDFLGDWHSAHQRCDRALLSHFPGDQLDVNREPLPRS